MQRWKRLSEQTLVENTFLTIKQVRFELPNGAEIPDYFIAERGNYILAVVVDENSRLLLEKQYRPGADDFVYEVPAGWIDQGESAENAAQREVSEETGYQAASITALGSFYPLAGFIKEEAFALLVQVNSQEQRLPQQEESENIQLRWCEQEEVRAMIQRNEIKCMGSLAALNLYWNALERK